MPYDRHINTIIFNASNREILIPVCILHVYAILHVIFLLYTIKKRQFSEMKFVWKKWLHLYELWELARYLNICATDDSGFYFLFLFIVVNAISWHSPECRLVMELHDTVITTLTCVGTFRSFSLSLW